jgi:arabinose-5-phosphate isomerase
MSELLNIGRDVIAEEAAALRQLADALDAQFTAAVETVRDARQLIVSGLGKSGNIAQKIAATLTSTGSPALYLHPVEALHGDLGIVTDRHVLIALSRSGNTDEMLRFVAHFRRLGGPVIVLTQNIESRLAELAQHVLRLPAVAEAGPLNLAPTTSCVQMLALGDALSMALLHARGFEPHDFAQFHPEGALGRRLLLRAADLMRGGDNLPQVTADEPFERLILTMTEKQLGMAIVLDPAGDLLGTFTDGDLRRLFERVPDPRTLDARAAFEKSRRSPDAPAVVSSAVNPHTPAVDCLQIMRESRITALVVVDDSRRPVGLLRLLDLIEAGLG